MNKLGIRVINPSSKHDRIFGPFTNEVLAGNFLKKYGWSELFDGRFILDKGKKPEEQIVCIIGEWIEDKSNFREIMPTHV